MASSCAKLKGLFANDVTIWTYNTHIDDSINTLKNDLEAIYQWLNPTDWSLFWIQQMPCLYALSINQSTWTDMQANNIKSVDHHKLLGLFDRHLSFEKHAAEVKKKVQFICIRISKAKSLYRTQVYCHTF